MKLVDPVCPMFEQPCRHCSEETKQSGLFTRLKLNPATGLFDPDGVKVKKIELGMFCNNDGRHFVSELKYCPARWGLRRGLPKFKPVVVVKGSGKPKKVKKV